MGQRLVLAPLVVLFRTRSAYKPRYARIVDCKIIQNKVLFFFPKKLFPHKHLKMSNDSLLTSAIKESLSIIRIETWYIAQKSKVLPNSKYNNSLWCFRLVKKLQYKKIFRMLIVSLVSKIDENIPKSTFCWDLFIQ